MRLTATLFLCALLLTACVQNSKVLPGTNIPQKVFTAPSLTRSTPLRTPSEIEDDLADLNQYIGSYPPRFSSEEEREMVFHQWADLFIDISAYKALVGDTEEALVYYADINRQGHNMDVKGAAIKADQALSLCLEKYPASIPAHFCSSYFYLSTTPEHFPKAEKSLIALRELHAPQMSSEVEAGFVYLYIMQRNKEHALEQIDVYLREFPEGSRKEEFLLFREHLMNIDEIGYEQL